MIGGNNPLTTLAYLRAVPLNISAGYHNTSENAEYSVFYVLYYIRYFTSAVLIYERGSREADWLSNRYVLLDFKVHVGLTKFGVAEYQAPTKAKIRAPMHPPEITFGPELDVPLVLEAPCDEAEPLRFM